VNPGVVQEEAQLALLATLGLRVGVWDELPGLSYPSEPCVPLDLAQKRLHIACPTVQGSVEHR
jgi:hypothetical protein